MSSLPPDSVPGVSIPKILDSVRRTFLRAISHLLRYHLGKLERDHIFADVQFAAEDDTREVHLTPAEITTAQYL